MLKPGERVGDWIVDGPLAEGGMGAVYRVHSPLTERLVAALKVMKPAADAGLRARFVREAEALAALAHPAVVRVMEFAQDEPSGLLYLVMELAEGETLRHRIERGPMDLREALSVFLPLAQGLDHAHERGVFHRDIKPSNIILCRDGGVRLVDFGIATSAHAEPLTDTGQLGTLAYLPPEVFRGEKTEPAAVDVYGFGLLLHEALTGRHSFSVDPSLTPAAAAAAIGVRKLQTEAIELPPGLPQPLRELVRRATALDAGTRPRMRVIRAALEALVERAAEWGVPAPRAPVSVPDESTTRVPDPTSEPLIGTLPAGGPRRFLVIGGLSALVAVGVAAWLARSRERIPIASAAGQGLVPERPRAGGRPRFEPSASPPATLSAAPAPAARASSLAALVEELEKPARTLAAPPLRPSGGFKPVLPPVAGNAPPLAPSPPLAQSADRPGPAKPLQEIAPADEPLVVAGELEGRWEVTHEVEGASQPSTGTRVGYRLTLEQEGDHVFGRGYRYTENGIVLPPDRRTAIGVDGHVEDGERLVLSFVESDAYSSRTSTVRWVIAPGAGALRGRFAGEAGRDSGSSVARRVR